MHKDIRIVSFEESEGLANSFVDLVEKYLYSRLLEANPKPIGLPTGRTMIPIYKLLVDRLLLWPERELNELIHGWESFNLDEYIGVSLDDINSYRYFMFKYLGEPLGLKKNQLRVPSGDTEEPEKEAYSYSKDLRFKGGLGFLILGLGVNGHIGFNEPPCSSDSCTRVVNLSKETRTQNSFSFGGNIDNVPTRAISIGLKEILSADEIHLVVTGIEKAEILYELLRQNCSKSLPASWLKLHQKTYVWADKYALTKVRLKGLNTH